MQDYTNCHGTGFVIAIPVCLGGMGVGKQVLSPMDLVSSELYGFTYSLKRERYVANMTELL